VGHSCKMPEIFLVLHWQVQVFQNPKQVQVHWGLLKQLWVRVCHLQVFLE
jgi:hypothetical protein